MHRIQTTIRHIAPAELPTVTPVGEEVAREMTEQELLDAGIVALGNDLYSCIHHEEPDERTLEWRPKEGQALPGTVISAGVLTERHAKLPQDVRLKVMRASIIRAKAGSAKDAVTQNLAEVGAVLADKVGLVEDAPLIDTTSQQAELAEAQRLATLPDSGLEREIVPMIDVTDADVVEADSLIPHSWAGEPRQ
jgi:hypothetical protein